MKYEETYCSGCREPARGVWRDFGIGAYEYCGATGVDHNWQWVSECCEQTVINSAGDPVDPPPYVVHLKDYQ